MSITARTWIPLQVVAGPDVGVDQRPGSLQIAINPVCIETDDVDVYLQRVFGHLKHRMQPPLPVTEVLVIRIGRQCLVDQQQRLAIASMIAKVGKRRIVS